jgi:hypothetical protein
MNVEANEVCKMASYMFAKYARVRLCRPSDTTAALCNLNTLSAACFRNYNWYPFGIGIENRE